MSEEDTPAVTPVPPVEPVRTIDHQTLVNSPTAATTDRKVT
jgi:hypothetical protein